MNDIIAKKYVKAILTDFEGNQLEELIAGLKSLALAFFIPKLKLILNNPEMNFKEKADFLYSLCDIENKKFHNLLLLLGYNDKLEALPKIYEELIYQKAVIDNSFLGLISGNFDLSEEKKKSLEEKFSNKFNAKIKFDFEKNNYDGIKVELDDLGYEVNFSIGRLEDQMSDHILKAL